MRHLIYIIPALIGASILLPAFVGGAWSPTRKRAVLKMLSHAKLQPGESVVDLGAGDGRILIHAVRTFRAHAVGIEIDPLRVALCKVRLFILNSRPSRRRRGSNVRAEVRMANFFEVDLSYADVVTFYLSQAAADKLAVKLAEELRPTARVVSFRRPIPGWIPTLHDTDDDIYVYTIGESVVPPQPVEEVMAT